MDRRAQLGFPPLEPWLRNLLVALFALYVVELVLRNTGFDVYDAAWRPFGAGFAAWQPVTRILVQGDSVLTVVFGLLTLYFLVPTVLGHLGADRLRQALAAGFVGGTAATLLLALAFADQGMLTGWAPTVIVTLLALFGLVAPEATIYLMFVLPVSARFLMYATGVFATLTLIVVPRAMGSAESFGVFFGVLGWWYGLGPGARRRDLKKKAAKIERELRRFEVIEGGRAQGDQGSRDEWIH